MDCFGSHPDQPLFVQSVLLFAHGVLAKGLPDFSALHPRVALTLSTGNSVMDFANSFTDLKIVFGNPSAYGEQSDTFDWRAVVSGCDARGCCASRSAAGCAEFPTDRGCNPQGRVAACL